MIRISHRQNLFLKLLKLSSFFYLLLSSINNPSSAESDIKKNLEVFTLNGKSKFLPLDKFEDFSFFRNKSLAKSFTLIDLEISSKLFISQISELINLESFVLQNVIWKEEFNGRAYLPKLVKVHIVRKNHRYSDISYDEFSSSLFFSSKLNELELPEITFIKGDLGGTFNLSHESISCKKIPFDVMRILGNRTISRIEMENSLVDINKINSSYIRELSLVNALVNGNLELLLGETKELKDLAIENVFDEKGNQINVNLDLGNFPEKLLKNIKIKNANIFSTRAVNLTSLTHIRVSDSSINFKNISISQESEVVLTLQNNKLKNEDDFFKSTKFFILIIENNSSINQEFNLNWLDNSQHSLTDLLIFNGVYIRLTHVESLNFTNLLFLGLINCNFDNYSIFDDSTKIELPKLMGFEADKFITLNLLNYLMSLEDIKAIMIHNLSLIEDKNLMSFLNQKFVISATDKKRNGIQLLKYDKVWVNFAGKDEKRDQDANFVFYTYFFTFLLISCFGLIGNFASIFILASKKFRSSSSTIILIALALFDSFILISFTLSILLYSFKLITLFFELFEIPMHSFYVGTEITLLGDREDIVQNIIKHDDFYSYFAYPLSKTAYTGSVYCTVLITVERFVAICFPIHIKKWASSKRSILGIFFVLIFSIAINFPRWLEAYGSKMEVLVNRTENDFELSEVRRFVRTYFEKNVLQESFYRIYYHGVFWTSFMYVIPIVTITTLNICIWSKVKTSKKTRRSMTTESRKENDEKEMRGLTLMLITISLIFTFCNILSGVLVVIFVSYGSYDPKDIEVISSIPIVINSSINFIIYFLMGKRFREEFYIKFRCKKKVRHNYHYTTTTN